MTQLEWDQPSSRWSAVLAGLEDPSACPSYSSDGSPPDSHVGWAPSDSAGGSPLRLWHDLADMVRSECEMGVTDILKAKGLEMWAAHWAVVYSASLGRECTLPDLCTTLAG